MDGSERLCKKICFALSVAFCLCLLTSYGHHILSHILSTITSYDHRSQWSFSMIRIPNLANFHDHTCHLVDGECTETN